MSSVIAFILIAMEVCSAHPGCSPEYMTNRCQVPDVTDDLLGSVHETLRGYAAVIKGDVTNAGGQKHVSYNDSAKSFNPLRLYSKVEPLSDASEKQFSVVRTHDTVMWRPRPTELTLLTLNAKAQFTEFSGNIRAFFRECERTPVAS